MRTKTEVVALLDRKAVVTATLLAPGISKEVITEMSQDLPAENLGELVADVIQKGWKAGIDPTASVVIIRFS